MADHFIPPPALPSPTGEALCRLCAESGLTCCSTDPDLTYLSFPLSGPEWRRLLPFAPLATLAPSTDGAAFAREEETAEKALGLLTAHSPGSIAGDAAGEAAGEAPEKAAGDAAGKMAKETAGRASSGKVPEGKAAAANAPPALPEQGDGIAASEPNHPDFLTSMYFLFPGQRERVLSLFPPEGRHHSLRTRADGSCVFLGSSGCRLPRSVRPWYCLLFPAWVSGGSLTLFLSPDCLISQKAKGPAHGIGLLDLRPARVRELHALLCRDWGLAPSP